jgi:hypothetical protein
MFYIYFGDFSQSPLYFVFNDAEQVTPILRIFVFHEPSGRQIDQNFLPHQFFGKYHEVSRRSVGEDQQAGQRAHGVASLLGRAKRPTKRLAGRFASCRGYAE